MIRATPQTIGRLLRERRQQTGLDQQTAATRAKVGRRLLVELEAGKRPNVSFATLVRLLGLFGFELEVRQRGLPSVTEEPTPRRTESG